MLLHLSRSLNDVLQLIVVHLLQVVHLPTLQLRRKLSVFLSQERNWLPFQIKNIDVQQLCSFSFQYKIFLLDSKIVSDMKMKDQIVIEETAFHKR